MLTQEIVKKYKNSPITKTNNLLGVGLLDEKSLSKLRLYKKVTERVWGANRAKCNKYYILFKNPDLKYQVESKAHYLQIRQPPVLQWWHGMRGLLRHRAML